jgi:hypothetical protein
VCVCVCVCVRECVCVCVDLHSDACGSKSHLDLQIARGSSLYMQQCLQLAEENDTAASVQNSAAQGPACLRVDLQASCSSPPRQLLLLRTVHSKVNGSLFSPNIAYATSTCVYNNFDLDRCVLKSSSVLPISLLALISR